MKLKIAFTLIGLCMPIRSARADYASDWHVISAAGTSVGGTYSLSGMIGLYDSGVNSGEHITLEDTFWSGIAPSGEEWVLRTTTGPSARFGHTMAYESARGVTVLFGGRFVSDDQTRYEQLGDVWEWNGGQWTQRTISSPTAGWKQVNGSWSPALGDVPVPRYLHAMAYDSRRGCMVMFGGAGLDPGGSQVFLGDTWEWDGLRWQLRAASGPPPRFNPAMAYDADRGVTVMTGGFGQTDPGVVWEWDGITWKSVKPTNGPATNYSQDAATMAYDNAAHEIVFGPTTDGFTTRFFWAWDGHDWQPWASDLGPPFYPNTPPYGALVYDSLRQQLVYFGGQNGYSSMYGGNTTGYLDEVGAWRIVESSQTSSFRPGDLLDAATLLRKIRERGDPVSQSVWNQFSTETQGKLNNADIPLDEKISALIAGLNTLLQSSSFYTAALFPALSPEALLLKALPPLGPDLIRFNRLLLEASYPGEITRSPSVPPGRMRLAAAYDSRRHALVVTGGLYNPTGIGKLDSPDTWELLNPDELQIDEQPSSLYRKVDELAGFHVGARAPAGTELAYQWFFQGRPLGDDGRILGSRSASLRIDTVKAGDAGQYYAVVRAGSQVIQSVSATLTLLPNLSIVAVPQSLHLVWGDPNVLLEQTDEITGTWTPVPGATSPFPISGFGTGKYLRVRATR